MEYIIMGLLGIAIILLLLSFFQKDRVKELEEQVDQLSLSLVQETYQMKKKLKVLEEELLQNEHIAPVAKAAVPVPFASPNEKILSLFKQGYPVEQIARISEVPTEEVRLLIEQYKLRSYRNE